VCVLLHFWFFIHYIVGLLLVEYVIILMCLRVSLLVGCFLNIVVSDGFFFCLKKCLVEDVLIKKLSCAIVTR
jgi:hypothetical protein